MLVALRRRSKTIVQMSTDGHALFTFAP